MFFLNISVLANSVRRKDNREALIAFILVPIDVCILYSSDFLFRKYLLKMYSSIFRQCQLKTCQEMEVYLFITFLLNSGLNQTNVVASH